MAAAAARAAAAEEARQARIRMQVRPHLQQLLMEVTDALFGEWLVLQTRCGSGKWTGYVEFNMARAILGVTVQQC